MSKAKSIPSGHHTLVPHLIVKNASAAIDFYKKAFGAEEASRLPGPDGKSIMHAELRIGDSPLFLVDEMGMPGCGKSPQTLGGTPITIHVWTENADAAFDRAVKAGATPMMPVMDAFWGDRYGRLKDPFGYEWSVATHQKDLTKEEITKAAQECFAQMGGSKK